LFSPRLHSILPFILISRSRRLISDYHFTRHLSLLRRWFCVCCLLFLHCRFAVLAVVTFVGTFICFRACVCFTLLFGYVYLLFDSFKFRLFTLLVPFVCCTHVHPHVTRTCTFLFLERITRFFTFGCSFVCLMRFSHIRCRLIRSITLLPVCCYVVDFAIHSWLTPDSGRRPHSARYVFRLFT